MEINSLYSQKFYSNVFALNASVLPVFGAVHPSKYFVKNQDGKYVEVKSVELVKTLQRKLIGWLNKQHNDNLNIVSGRAASVKPVNASEKPLFSRLVRFFINRDEDYKKNPIARSFYDLNRQKGAESYILTGHSISIVEDAAKPIRNVKRDIKVDSNEISDTYGLDLDKTKRFVSENSNIALLEATKTYFHSAKSVIRRVLQKFDKKNSVFEAYFTPVIKGKKVKYELENATFNGS